MAHGVAANIKLRYVRIGQGYGGTAIFPELGLPAGSGAELQYANLHASDQARCQSPTYTKPADGAASTQIVDTAIMTVNDDSALVGFSVLNNGAGITESTADYAVWWIRVAYPDGTRKTIVWAPTRPAASGGTGTIANAATVQFCPTGTLFNTVMTFARPRLIQKGSVIIFNQIKYGAGVQCGEMVFTARLLPVTTALTPNGNILGGSITEGVRWVADQTNMYEMVYTPNNPLAAVEITAISTTGYNSPMLAQVLRVGFDWGSTRFTLPLSTNVFLPPADMMPEYAYVASAGKFTKELLGACPRIYIKAGTSAMTNSYNIYDVLITEYLQ